MKEQFSRTALLLGDEAMERLFSARVAVFGLGGVGGFAAEALARAGVGALDLCDNDTVSESNRNRQLLALESTLGKKKTEVAAARLRDINPGLKLTTYDTFFLPETAGEFDFSKWDYIVDAIDTVAGKMELIRRARAGRADYFRLRDGQQAGSDQIARRETGKNNGLPLGAGVAQSLQKRGHPRRAGGVLHRDSVAGHSPAGARQARPRQRPVCPRRGRLAACLCRGKRPYRTGKRNRIKMPCGKGNSSAGDHRPASCGYRLRRGLNADTLLSARPPDIPAPTAGKFLGAPCGAANRPARCIGCTRPTFRRRLPESFWGHLAVRLIGRRVALGAPARHPGAGCRKVFGGTLRCG